ncbi:TonB-dependent receptor domain-containing protein [Piscinibacter sakaiensis]|uniref:TonB-dependent receptor domain-containing protein n=1 Tax=Piscinibacter sakaiensis TaxID=1547922 RepID=UPI003AAC83DE
MFRRTKVSAAVVTALGGLLALGAAPSHGQQTLDRVEITGSSIKRIAAEGALPVQIVTSAQIQRSGATTVAEVIQRLPAMQGFQIADIAAGSNSGGIVTASIHDIGASYTLVLLNGRRIAPTGSGATINLNSIPMSAIDRVEVLTDGASALYGSDAIAGVVNFILKKNLQGGSFDAAINVPTEGAGKSGNVSFTYGVGDLYKDRFNFLFSVRHDEQQVLKATDREFSKSAYLPFTKEGKQYVYDRTSVFAVPANASVTFKRLPGETTTLPSYAFNPYRKQTGACGPMNFYSLNNATTATSVTENCAFDFGSTVEVYPENKRDTMFLAGQFQATENLKFFSEFAYSRFDLTARIAANPVPVSIPLTSDYYRNSVLPYLTPAQAARVNTVTANYRAQDFGTRDSQTVTDAKHFVIGADAEIGGWSTNAGLTWSENALNENYVGGYFRDKEFRALLAANAFDPFKLSGNQTPAVQSLMNGSIFNGSVRTQSTTLTGADFRASRELFRLPAGPLSIGLGGDFRNYHYKQTPSAAALAGEIYNYSPYTAYDLERDSHGVFAEVLVPIVKNLEVTGAFRYDTTKAVKDALKNRTVGDDMSASTYKVSGRYQASQNLLFRGSFGTGFKAPSMLDIAQPLVPNGVTASAYDCPFPGTEFCKPGKLQYTQLAGGNEKLVPEKSKNWTAGLRFEPTANFGMGIDYWRVEISDAVSAVSANQAFADPNKYRSLFTTFKQPAEPQAYWTFISSSTNIGKAINSGVDWDFISRHKTPVGQLTLSIAGTYLIESSYTRPGTDSDFTDSMGKYGENAAVSFRNIYRATAILDSGKFSNSLTVNYRSGYEDQNQLVRDLATNTNVRLRLDVPDYYTLDWQGIYRPNKSVELRAGVKNLLNKAPHLSLRDSSGHQVGYDPRYNDPLMRTVYVAASYKF